MPGLCDLPDEVILQSLNSGILCPADFAALALSCRRLKDVAEDTLYGQNRDHDRSSAVEWAAIYGNTATLYKALQHRLTIDEGDSPSQPAFNPFQTAVEHGQDSAVAWFLDHGVDIVRRVRPRCRCRIAQTCILHAALCLRHPSTALLLISRGAPLKYLSTGLADAGENYMTALLEASMFGLDTVVEALVKDHGMTPRMRPGDPREQDALACAAMSDDNVSMIKTLVGLGADVNWSYKEWNLGPLHFAIVNGNFAIAHTLLDLGAKIHSYDYDLDKEDEEDEEEMKSGTREVVVSPLHHTVASFFLNSTLIHPMYAPTLFLRGLGKDRHSTRSSFMKRLIELGVDVNMKVSVHWEGNLQHSSPLDVAIAQGATQDVSTLIAAGAMVNSRMLYNAWEEHEDDEVKWMAMTRLLLKHGARLDEPTQSGMTMLQLAARDAKMMEEMSRLHEMLVLSSPKSLSHEHLSEVLADSLAHLDWYTSNILIRHGGRVSSEDKLFSIAITIIEEVKICLPDDLEDSETKSLYDLPELPGCVRFVLDMGLSNEDQCLIFHDILHKRQLALAHLFLDRGVASKPEATQYLPAYLMLAASWGNVCVIKRLWHHAHGALDSTLRLLTVHTSIMRDNCEAVSFFMEHGTTPFECLLPAHVSQEYQMHVDAFDAQTDWLKRPKPVAGESSARLSMQREFRRVQLRAARHFLSSHTLTCLWPSMSPLQLAVQYGHMDIINNLLEHIPQDVGATTTCWNIYIPCVLKQANEIKEMIEKAEDLARWSIQFRIE